MNRLYFGDNLKWLSDRKEFPDASVDLVYLDPPFNSNADYNVLFREPSGQVSQAQFHAFTDTWTWLTPPRRIINSSTIARTSPLSS
jgi:adenine specific DNA methylase Mod